MEFVILPVIIIVLFVAIVYTWYQTNRNYSIVTSEIKTVDGNLVTVKNDLKNQVTTLSNHVDAEYTGLQKSLTTKVTSEYTVLNNNLKSLSSNVKAENEAQVRNISTLMNYGKVSEIGQAQITAYFTKTGQGKRVDSTTVLFKEIYSKPPKVIIFPVRLDTPGAGTKFEITVSNITTTGFTLTMGTWDEGQLSSAVIQYTVIV